MKWFRRITISLSVALFGIACGAMLLFNWSAFGFKALTVPTGSMRPGIPPGSFVLMRRTPSSQIKVGDVITYADPLSMHKTITHRVVKSYKLQGKVDTFITKGDANLSADPIPVVSGQVFGKTVWHAPRLGSWMSWSKTWTGVAILVYLPALIIIVEEIRRLSNYFKSMQPYVAPGFHGVEIKSPHHFATAAKVSAVFIILSFVVVALPAHALLRSNTVSLANNHLAVAGRPPSNTCSNSNNVSVSNSSSQTATSGSASSSNNTNGGSVTSGNASNSNSTSINININNNCH